MPSVNRELARQYSEIANTHRRAGEVHPRAGVEAQRHRDRAYEAELRAAGYRRAADEEES